MIYNLLLLETIDDSSIGLRYRLWSSRHDTCKELCQWNRRAKLVAMIDPSGSAEAALRELCLEKSYADYHDALEDPEINAVIVVTPTVLHHDIVMAAATAGKDIFCEKPMAMNVAECQDMVNACRHASVHLQLGFMRRYARDFMAAKEVIDSGKIGDPVLIKSLTHGPSVPQPWMYDIAKSNGPLAEVNSHDIDTLRWFANDDIRGHAVGGNYRCPEAKVKYPDFYDTVAMTLRFVHGAEGMIDGAVSVGYGYDARLEVLGTKGTLFVGSLEESRLIVCSSTDKELSTPAVKSWRTLFIDAYREEDRASFAASMKGGNVRPQGKMARPPLKPSSQEINLSSAACR